MDDEAKPLGRNDQISRMERRHAGKQHGAPRHKAHCARAMTDRRADKLLQRLGMGVTEQQPDAERQCAVTHGVETDHIREDPRRRSGRRLDRCDGLERRDAVVSENIAGARGRPVRGDDRQSVENGAHGIFWRDCSQPDRWQDIAACRSALSAANPEMKSLRGRISALGRSHDSQSHVR